ncbi:hypothetical protein [Modicisalibacter radicis]|uniref:hypothetical protein n=1 Tax=Halomonas sp. EAR18 TaxID=2518972 RepID=UPI00109D3F26|nr:hypothetical protein [Halomonas sp. EAR18]
MINTMIARVIGASRYEFEGRKGGKLSIIDDADASNDNQVGLLHSEMSAEYSVVDQIRDSGAQLPCNLEIDVDFRTVRSSSNATRTTLHVVAIRVPKASGHPGGQSSKPDAKSAS